MATLTLAVRLIPILLLKGSRMVKGVRFAAHRDVGNPVSTARVYDAQGVDELIFLDIAATQERRTIDFKLVEQVAENCFMPFTVGGGVSTVDQIRELLRRGADKVAINSAAVLNPHLISEAAERFGSQAIVVSIDYRGLPGANRVYIDAGRSLTGLDAARWAVRAAELGAGEILLTSIEREGTRQGYDLPFLREVADDLPVPVIANGGVGALKHLAEGITEGHASAIAASTLFHFSDQSTIKARTYLQQAGMNVRPV